MKSNKGFTLIELLVVVLIIGILAAIAVPQYQKAVFKSKAGQIMSLIRSIANSEEVYWLANNSYTPNFDDLDISVLQTAEECSQAADHITSPCKRINDWDVYLFLHGNVENEVVKSVEAQYKDIVRITNYLQNYRHQNDIRMQAGELTCIALSNNQKGNELCQSLGTTKIADGYYRL